MLPPPPPTAKATVAPGTVLPPASRTTTRMESLTADPATMFVGSALNFETVAAGPTVTWTVTGAEVTLPALAVTVTGPTRPIALTRPVGLTDTRDGSDVAKVSV